MISLKNRLLLNCFGLFTSIGLIFYTMLQPNFTLSSGSSYKIPFIALVSISIGFLLGTLYPLIFEKNKLFSKQ